MPVSAPSAATSAAAASLTADSPLLVDIFGLFSLVLLLQKKREQRPL